MRGEDERYFERIESRLEEAFDRAETARLESGDPRPEVEIPVAKDMADRVENILGIPGVAERVRELEAEMSREEAALALAEDFAEGRVGEYETRDGKIEGAVRTAVALLTEGVVAAPIEGIDRVELLENDDGTECVRVYYAGPIRSAGGTAQALSVLVADYTRALLGVSEYQARDDEIERYAEEVGLYDKTTGLQYSPKDEETKFIARHCPIMLDGEATGDAEVSGFRDLERVGTNNPRGGMCLVLAEGIALKAPKIQRYTRELDEIDWPWLQDLIDGTIGEGEGSDDEDDESTDGDETEDTEPDEPAGPPRVEPATKFLRDLIAGRPVFSHPSRPGGFRLRYGRARNHGFATGGIHPATMHVVDDFLATGTQIKTERPGKAHGIIPVDTIEGPTVRLANGEVRRIDDAAEALEVRNGVERIIDAGEYLVNFGEFVENNHPLAPASYTFEWWIQEFENSAADVQALADSPHVDLESPSVEEALDWATEYDAPLHPAYTYLWHDLSTTQFEALADAVEEGTVKVGELELTRTQTVREALETLLVEHRQTAETLSVPEWRALVATMGFSEDLTREWDSLSEDARAWDGGQNAMKAVEEVAPFTVRERAPTRIGNRMGRPEKSEKRELSPAVHTLFPIGEAGGAQRDVAKAARYAPGMRDTPGEVEVSVGRRECAECGTHTFRGDCPDCGANTFPHYECPDCGTELEPDEAGRVECARCEVEGTSVERRTLDLDGIYHDALSALGEREGSFETLKGVKGLTSSHKTPEPMEKGILRAKHGVSAFKDGTIRYDMTDLPVTSVRPEELDVSVEEFRRLGYHDDVEGAPLEHDDQLVELKVQDIVLSDGAAEHLLKTADFVDELLEDYYGLDPFYEMTEREELVGELVFGMAPHTSAAVVGRVIGFTSAAVGYAHPYFHASKRRNCFHPEMKVWVRETNDNWRYNSIEDLVEGCLDDPRTDDFGTLVEELDGELFVPSIEDDGSVTTRPIEAVSKHPAPDHLLEIETRSGRRLRVTPDHSMRRWNDGVERITASELEPGDTVPSPKHLSMNGQEREIDLLAELLACDAISNEDLMIRGLGPDRIRGLFDDATSGDTYLDRVADRLDVAGSTVYNWVGRDSVPAAVLVALFDEETVVERLPDDVELGVRRDSVSVDRVLRIDENVGTLLGYYTAEGFTRQEDGQFYQTTICTPDEPVREQIVDTFETALGVTAYEENEWKVTVSGRLIAALFADVLDTGPVAADKRIPDVVLGGTDSVLSAYLAAYFSGDGSVSNDRLDIRAHTISDELKEDLIAALKRFGITSKTYTETRRIETGPVSEFYEESPEFESWVLKITSENAVRFAELIGFDLDRKSATLSEVVDSIDARPQRLFGDGGEVWLDEVVDVSIVESDADHTYSVTVEDTHTLVANDLFTGQCDGDEDCVMLLMDGLLNFSKEYLPDKRGGQMDAPLVMSSRIDPAEIDDEAHNMDVVERYPLEFYEATREMADPGEVDIRLAEESVGTDDQYRGFAHTHDTSNIALGPDLSAYKTLGSMMEKMDAQLELARKLRAVDETDVAERVIEYHFLPDLIGNLRAFSSQETRCLSCGKKYRRMPLSGDCRDCGGNVNLTVHQGSVNKYMDTAIRVAEEYGCREYTKQRLKILDRSLESVFENDKNKQSGIADFM
ncbi:DNA polymerase II large subunit [Halalkalicoccus sp. NIPERK01]|uniref:DNA polymerase II large subunit n=1 Tax=Halalkalicoccus sp. NIPERK01 TaxID=3053469 RepID=UPI00256F1113|nr:DNA polymerase II large subunit [Halalkalicoccus sp. NIPERK01]MDL5362951.1 DNA polymerase II large subunit [Halalkalicoccus sp. NIPERK01]